MAAATLVRQNAVGTGSVSPSTITLPSVNAGDGLVLQVADWDGAGQPVLSVSDSAGGSWTRTAVVNANDPGQLEQWYCPRHPGSAGTLTVSVQMPGTNPTSLSISEWSTPLVYSAVTNSAPQSSISKPVTVASLTDYLVIGAVYLSDNSIPPVIAPAIALTSATASGSGIAPAYVTATTASTTVTWTGNNSNWTGVLVAYFPAAATVAWLRV